jgi:osmoprotectant transport system permease protein
MSDFIDAFTFIGDHGSLIIDSLKTHLVISLESIAIAIVIGVPLGVWLGHMHRFSFLAINMSNIGRALPSLGVLAILLPITGIGRTGVIITLVLLAFPPILTNAYVAVDQVDPDIADASKGLGFTPMQVLGKVEMPLALPLIFAGIRISTVFVVATATLAGLFGGGGMGDIINDRETYGLDGVIGASYVLIVLAFGAQLVFLGIERLVTPAGIRLTRARTPEASARKQAALQGRAEEVAAGATNSSE